MPPVKKIKQKALKHTENESEASPVVSGQLQKKIKKLNQKLENQRGVILIKHLPHGFFEEQLRKYFEQFGTVTRLRLVRSKHTGGSKGYAFVEFEYPEVAQVAADTMDNYLMFKKVVKATYIPPSQQHFNYFRTSLRKVKNKAGKEIYTSSKIAATNRKVKQHNDWSSENAYQKRTERNLHKITKLKKKYEHLGIDFSKILIEPKQVNTEEIKTAEEIGKEKKSSCDDSEESDHKKSNHKNKRKVDLASQSSSKTQKRAKKDVELKDLLGSTIAEDSEDEDWKADEADDKSSSTDESSGWFAEAPSSEIEEEGSDEQQSDEQESDEQESDDQESDEKTIRSKNKKKPKSQFEICAKSSKIDHLDKIIKRKPHLGGIQKASKKKVIKASVSTAKKSMQLAAAKELTKTKALLKSKQKKRKIGKLVKSKHF